MRCGYSEGKNREESGDRKGARRGIGEDEMSKEYRGFEEVGRREKIGMMKLRWEREEGERVEERR